MDIKSSTEYLPEYSSITLVNLILAGVLVQSDNTYSFVFYTIQPNYLVFNRGHYKHTITDTQALVSWHLRDNKAIAIACVRPLHGGKVSSVINVSRLKAQFSETPHLSIIILSK